MHGAKMKDNLFVYYATIKNVTLFFTCLYQSSITEHIVSIEARGTAVG